MVTWSPHVEVHQGEIVVRFRGVMVLVASRGECAQQSQPLVELSDLMLPVCLPAAFLPHGVGGSMPLGLSCGTRRMYDIPSVTPACFLTFSLYFRIGVQGLFDQVEDQFQGVGGGCLVGDDVDVLEQPFREMVQIVSVARHRRLFVFFDFRMQPVMPAHLHEGTMDVPASPTAFPLPGP